MNGTVTVTAPGGPTFLRSALAVPTALTSALALPNGLASPVAPVHAGGGGAARFASVDARSSSPGTKHAVIGLVLASAAAVAVAVRSARRPQTSETDMSDDMPAHGRSSGAGRLLTRCRLGGAAAARAVAVGP